jgi:hypothetical protein
VKYQGRKWGYLVHLGDYPWPWQYSPAQPLHAPDSMKNVEVKWTYFPLTAEEENKKYQAIKEYQSQLKVAPAFLEAFVRKNELFIPNEKKVLRYNDSITVKKPVSDNFIDEWHTGPHFKSVLHRAAIAYLNIKRTDKKLIVGLKTRQEIKKGVQYKFHMRLFQESLVKKLELTINNNKLSASPNAENSMSLPPGSVLCIKDNLIVELPERILEGVDTLLLYAETIDNGRLIDKTSCQLLQVSGDERR